MDYAFKITTHGRAVIAACGDLEKPLRVTRVAVGSGMVPTGVNLTHVHELYQYVAEGAVGGRRHENDHLFLTVQYANSEHPEQPDFVLSEFMVFAENPETGQEIDLLYATLGNYRQPVPAWRAGIPGSVFSYPLVTAVSDEIKVEITASPGIVTHDELETALAVHNGELMGQVMSGQLSTALTTTGGEIITTTEGANILAVQDISISHILARVREIVTQAQAEAVSAAGTAADAKISAHNTAESSHPAQLSVATKS